MSSSPPPRGPRLACPACGLPIGVYEPLWHVKPETGAERSAWLQLAGDRGASTALAGTLWHADCAERDGIPGG